MRVVCVCVNVASPFGCALFLYYLCAFQIYPVCVVTSDGCLVFLHCLVT